MTEAEAEATPSQRYSRHGRSHSRHSGRSHQSRLLVLGLTIALAVAALALIGTAVYTSLRIRTLTDVNSTLQQQVFLGEQEVEKVRADLEQVKAELAQLIEGRLPTVRRLEPDQVLEIGADNIKNIVFTMVRRNDSPQYEYKLVVENLSKADIKPKFRVLLFDKYGIQIGMDQVAMDGELKPGESRSVSKVVQLFIKDEPAYFQVSPVVIEGLEL